MIYIVHNDVCTLHHTISQTFDRKFEVEESQFSTVNLALNVCTNICHMSVFYILIGSSRKPIFNAAFKHKQLEYPIFLFDSC